MLACNILPMSCHISSWSLLPPMPKLHWIFSPFFFPLFKAVCHARWFQKPKEWHNPVFLIPPPSDSNAPYLVAIFPVHHIFFPSVTQTHPDARCFKISIHDDIAQKNCTVLFGSPYLTTLSDFSRDFLSKRGMNIC